MEEYAVRNENGQKWDVVVIGAGMAGLAASIFLAQAGQKVLVLEKAPKPGGRAATTAAEGALLNLGAHALFPGAIALLRKAGVEPAGGPPKLNGMFVLGGGKQQHKAVPAHQLFLGSFLKWREKIELIRFYARLRKIDAAALDAVPLQTFLATAVRSKRVRRFAEALVRLSTYCSAAELMSAGAAVRQLQAGSVLYADGGWGSIVEALKEQAQKAGVFFLANAPAVRITGEFPDISVSLKDGTVVNAQSVLSTAAPREMLSLLEQSLPAADADIYLSLTLIHAACLDVVLDGVPQPRTTFGLGIDRPLYFSNHSASAKLSGNPKMNVVHVLKYGSPGEGEGAAAVEQELEQFLDSLQPGWRDRTVFRRFLPKMTVSHAIVTAEQGGLAGRPGVEVPFRPGLYVAGDWVGNEGQLLQASLSSANEAARCIIEAAAKRKEVFGHGTRSDLQIV